MLSDILAKVPKTIVLTLLLVMGINFGVPAFGEGMGMHVILSLPVDPDVEFLAWSSDETKIVTAGRFDQILQVWDWRKEKAIARLEKHAPGGRSIEFMGTVIVTSPIINDASNALSLWNYESGKIDSVSLPAPGVYQQDQRFVFSGSGGRAAIWRTPQRVTVFDTTSWTPILDLGDVRTFAIALSPNGNELAVLNNDGTVTIYDVGSKTKRLSFVGWSGSSYVLCWSPDGKMLLSSESWATYHRDPSSNKVQAVIDRLTLKAWDPVSGQVVAQYTSDENSNHDARSLAFSPNSRYFASTDENNEIQIWDAARLVILQTIKIGGRADFIRFSPSGKFLAVSRRDCVLIIDTAL